MGFISVRNGPFRGAILGISGAEMGHIRGRNGPFRRAIRRRSDCNKTQVADCQCHTQPSQNSRICGRRDGCSKKRAYFRVMGEYLFISMSVFSYIYSFSYDVPVCLSARAMAVFPTCRESVFGRTYILFRALAMTLYINVTLLFGRVYILFHIVAIILYINVLLFFGHAYILFQCLSGRFADKKRVRTQIHLSKRRDVENNCVTLLLVFAAAYGRSLIQ